MAQAVSFFAVGRNEPCPCGSERKYKRCCMEAVESALRALSGRMGRFAAPAPRGNAVSELLRGLALACALPPDPDLDEEPLPLATAVRLIDEVLKALGKEDVAAIQTMHEGLVRLLEEDEELRHVRFWPEETQKVLAQVPEIPPDGTRDPEETDRLRETILRPLVTPDQADDAAWALMVSLRRPGRDENELRSLVWGLLNAVMTFHTPLGENMLWRAILHLTMEEVAGFDELAHRIAGESEGEGANSDEGADTDMDTMYDYLQKHPVIDRQISRQYWLKVEPAIQAMEKGEIALAVPPYALAHSFLSLREPLLRQVASLLATRGWDGPAAAADGIAGLTAEDIAGKPGAPAVSDQDLMNVKLTPADRRRVILAAWNEDYPFFVPAIREALTAWLDQQGATAPPELAEAVRHLTDTFGSDLLNGERHVFDTILWLSMARAWRSSPVLAPAASADERPISLVDFIFNPEGPERYAAALETAGLTEPARHVRAAAAHLEAQPCEES